MKHRKLGPFIGAALALMVSAPLTQPVQAQKESFASAREVWPGRRMVMLLPLQLSDNWNADARWGQSLLRPSEAQLRTALERTGKFSVVQPYRFDPILQRALLDKRITKDQIDELVTTPSLQSASSILANLGFDLPPLIADFRLEEVRASGSEKAPTIQVQVLGKLYPINSQEADQTKVFTSDPTRYRISQFDTVISAATNAFQMIANEFVKPITEAILPRVEPPPAAEDAKGKNGKAPGKGAATPAPVAPVAPTTPGAPTTPAAPTTPVVPPTPTTPATPATPSTNASPSATAKTADGDGKTTGDSTNNEGAVYVNPLNRGSLTRNP
jgi:hypothetical protein